MAGPIDIEVKDEVDSSIQTKITGIAKAARSGYTELEKLKKALGDLNSSNLAELTRMSNSYSSALTKQLSAQARVTEATSKSAVASARAATEAQKLATEAQRTAAAEQNAARAAAQSEAAQLRLAQAHERAANAKSRDEKEAEKLANAAARLKQSVDPLAAELDRLNAELAQNQSLFARGVVTGDEFIRYQNILEQKIKDTNAAISMQNEMMGRGTKSSKAMTQAQLNLSRQFADVGVTAAMGMNPIMILIQQGPQIADAFMMAKTQGLGFTAVLKGMWATLVPFLPILLAVAGAAAVVAGGFALLDRQLRKDYPKNITDGMKLTEEQMDRVKSKTVTFGDTIAATFVVIGRKIMDSPIGDALKWLQEMFTKAFDAIALGIGATFTFIISIHLAAIRTIEKSWKTFPDVLGEIFISAANAAIDGVNALIQGSLAGINLFTREANKLLSDNLQIPELDVAPIAQMENKFAGSAQKLGSTFGEEFNAAWKETRKGQDDFLGEIGAEALARARKRALKEAGKPNKGRSGMTEEEKRAKALLDVNRELDSEIKNLKLVGDAREIESRMSSIVDGLAQKRITLTDSETKGLRDKVVEIQHLAKVQSEMTRIYEDATHAETDHSLGLEASKKLLDAGKISAEEYGKAVNRIELAYAQAKDPLFDFNQGLADQTALYGKFGSELESAARLQQLKHELDAKGIKLTTDQTAALKSHIDEQVRQEQVNSELQSIWEANQGAAEALSIRTAALSESFRMGVIGAEQYRIGLNGIAMEAANVAIRQTEMATAGQLALASLQSYMENYQGLLPGLTQSFGNFFTTVADGFADSIARSIVYAESFEEAMKNVARTAISELISSLIKLGTQWLITQAIGATVGAGAAAASAGQGAIVAAAWAPAAAAVSLATLGANAIPAGVGIASTYALTAALSAIPAFANGGDVRGAGGPKSDSILSWLSDGEYVVNAHDAARNRPLLDAINSGSTWEVPGYADGGSVSTPASVYRPSTNSTSYNGGGTHISLDLRGANFGGNDPDEMEDRFMRAIATKMVPEILNVAREQANDDMTVRFERPTI